MKIVYQAENILDAHLVKGALENHDIPAFVTGEYLTGAIGELPAHGLVAIMVPDDHVDAAALFLRALQEDRRRYVETESEPELVDLDWEPKPA
jgi:hypothetical protein